MKRIWKTKTGKKIKIKDMTTKHIKNCIALLNSYHSHQYLNACSFLSSLRGEVAIETMENNIASIDEDGWEDEAEEYIATFENELNKRKEK